MSNKVEGTVVLDGLIEGKVSKKENFLELIEQWVDFCKKNGVILHPQIEGNSFNILAGNNPINVKLLNNDTQNIIRGLLSEFTKLFEKQEIGNILSTLRSHEYIENKEIQSIYGIKQSGDIEINSREVDAVTVKPEKEITTKEKVLYLSVFLAVVMISLFISSFFIDYKKIFSDVKNNYTSLKSDELTLNNDIFNDFFKIDKIEIDKQYNINIFISKTDKYPLNINQLNELYNNDISLNEKLIYESLAKGYINLEFFNKDLLFIKNEQIRIDDLKNNDKIVIIVSYQPELKPAFMKINY